MKIDTPLSETAQETKNESTCPECSGTIVKEETEFVCQSCGIIVGEDNISRGRDWRAYNSEQKEERRRTGPGSTSLFHDKGLATQIGDDKNMSKSQQKKFSRLRKHNSWARTQENGERNIKRGNTEINRMGSAMGVKTNVRETACRLFTQAYDEDVQVGRSIEDVSSACLYIATRQFELPYSPDDIMKVSRSESRKAVISAMRQIKKRLNLALSLQSIDSFVTRYVSVLDLPHDIEILAKEAHEKLGEKSVSGRSRSVCASGAIYAAAQYYEYQNNDETELHEVIRSRNEYTTQSEIAEVAGVTEVSLRNIYKDYVDQFDDVNVDDIEENIEISS